MNHKESDIQIMLMQWVELQKNDDLKLIFAIPNGGKRNIREAARLKREGVRAGVPDLFLPVARYKYNGLFIELKADSKGRLSDNQKKWIKLLSEQNYCCLVAYGFEQAKTIISSYINETQFDGL